MDPRGFWGSSSRGVETLKGFRPCGHTHRGFVWGPSEDTGRFPVTVVTGVVDLRRDTRDRSTPSERTPDRVSTTSQGCTIWGETPGLFHRPGVGRGGDEELRRRMDVG